MHIVVGKYIIDGGEGEVGIPSVVAQVDAVFPEVQRHRTAYPVILVTVVFEIGIKAGVETR